MTFVSTEGKCKSEEERKANAKIADERKAAENAKAILGWLMPSNARTDRIIFVLRNAANMARTATLTRLESKRALDDMRTEAATSLNQVCSLLDRGGLTQDAIDQAAQQLQPGSTRCLDQKIERPQRRLLAFVRLRPRSYPQGLVGIFVLIALRYLRAMLDYRSLMDNSAGREDRQEQIGLMSKPLSVIHHVADVILVPVKIATLGT